MNKGRQLRLPKLGKVKKVARARKLPQPHIGKVRGIKKFELLHRPFDLRFRGKIRNWLEFLQARKLVNFESTLDEFQKKVIRLYFYPQRPEGRWLNQNEVLTKVKLNSKKKLRTSLVDSLMQTWLKIK